MDGLIGFLEGFIALEDNAFKLVFDREDVKDEIIRLVTIEQLYEKGVDETGQSIQPEGYAPYTITQKILTGERYDHVTLKQTGQFYDSFEVIVTNDELTITANDLKGEKRLFNIYGNEIAGLTDESMESLLLFIRDVVFEILEGLKT
jgi:hypothetical protein